METSFDHDCRRYIRTHARAAKLDGQLAILKARLVPQLQEGKKSPRELPFLLVLRKRTRILSEWKEALKRQLKLWLITDEAVDKRITEIQGGFASEQTEALYVEINKDFQAKIETKKSA